MSFLIVARHHITLMSKEGTVAFDNISVSNGDFEELTEEGLPKEWWGIQAHEVIRNKSEAKSCEYFIVLKMKEDGKGPSRQVKVMDPQQPITITFFAKSL